MMMTTTMMIISLIVYLSIHLSLVYGAANCPIIDYADPLRASLRGGSEISLFGCGFAQSAFHLNGDDPNYGNHVYLVDKYQTYKTTLIEQGATILKFNSPKLKKNTYNIKVVIDGVEVPNNKICPTTNCKIDVLQMVTPSIEKFTPYYSEPGAIIELRGKIFTSRYTSNMDAFTVGRPQSIIRIYDGPGNCEPQKVNSDEFYGIGLDSKDSDYGYIKCKRSGTLIGSLNVSFIVDTPFGRNQVLDKVYRVDRREQTFMHQAYPTLNSVNTTSSSSIGGGEIHIMGHNLDAEQMLNITVDELECRPIEQSATEVKCILDINNNTQKNKTIYPGNRGVFVECWPNITANTENELTNLDFHNLSTIGCIKQYVDVPEFIPSSLFTVNGLIRTHFIFIAPKRSDYAFTVTTSGNYVLLGGKTNELLTVLTLQGGITNYMALEKDEQFVLELRNRPSSMSNQIRLCALMYNTSINSQQFEASIPTVQDIIIKSDGATEIQTVNHSGIFSLQTTGRPEIQSVSIPTTYESFKLCMFNSCTESYGVDNPNKADIVADLTERFNNSAVQLTMNKNNLAQNLKITFPAEFGDIPLFEVRTSPASPIPIPVVETQKGILALNGKFRPTYDGYYAFATYQKESTEAEIAAAYTTLGSAWCPSKLIQSQIPHAYFEDFETSTNGRVVKGEAFCGTRSMFHPRWYNFPSKISLNVNPYVCFAIKGRLRNTIWFYYNAFSNKKTYSGVMHGHSIDLNSPDENVWKFKCINALESIQNNAYTKGATIFQLRAIYILQKSYYYETDVFVYLDTLFVGTKPLYSNPDDVVTWPRFPSKYFDNVLVQKSQTNGLFSVEINPSSCEDNFSLFGITGLREPPDNSVGNQKLLRDPSWNEGVGITISRTRTASVKPRGHYVLSFKDIPTIPISVNWSTFSLIKRSFWSHPLIGSVEIRKWATCTRQVYKIKFLSLPGDQPLMKVYDTSSLTGDNVQINVIKVSRGYLKICPISGDMVATAHKKPQVRIYVDDVPSRCGSNCDHLLVNYDEIVINDVNVQLNLDLLIVTITGTGFTQTDYSLHLMEGSIEVMDIAAFDINPTTLRFFNQPVTNLSAGLFKAHLRIAKFGYYHNLINLDLGSQQAEIAEFSFTNLTNQNNVRIEIVGNRFSPGFAKVLIGQYECIISTITLNNITCSVPVFALSGTVQLRILQHGIEIRSSKNFTSNLSDNIGIDEVLPSGVASITGNTLLQLIVCNMTSDVTIFIGNERVNKLTFINESLVTLLAPAQSVAGVKPISFFHLQSGYVTTNVTVTYYFEVTNVEPKFGSWMGGQIIQLIGKGFNKHTQVWIKPSTDRNCYNRSVEKCDIISMNDTIIQCKTKALCKSHYITNSGTDDDKGFGYNWQPRTVTILPCDTVHWIWNSYYRRQSLKITQVDNLDDFSSIEGFSSGVPTLNGHYQFTFSKPGLYYYTSSDNFVMYGVVEVRPFEDCVAELSVTSETAEAIYYPVLETVTLNEISTCENQIVCTELNASMQNSTRPIYVLRGCATPYVDGFDPRTLIADQQLRIRSKILSNCTNELKIQINESNCDFVGQNLDDLFTFNCTLTRMSAVNGKLRIGSPIKPTIVHTVLGEAVLATSVDRKKEYLYFLPSVVCQMVNGVGSVLGGGKLIIYGSGFEWDTSLNRVTLSTDQECIITYTTSGEIHCRIPAPVVPISQETARNVAFKVFVKSPSNSDWLEAEQINSSSCIYAYDWNVTPYINAVQPEVISVPQTISIDGQNLLLQNEQLSMININLNGIPCEIDINNSNFSTIICHIQDPLSVEDLVLNFTHSLRGQAVINSNISLQTAIVVNSMTPQIGSIAGETLLNFNGSGLDHKSLIIKIGSRECKIIYNTPSTVHCLTPSIEDITTDAVQSYNFTVGFYTGNKLCTNLSTEFQYNINVTPTVLRYTTTVITTNDTQVTEFTIIGNLLTNSADLDGNSSTTVKLGKINSTIQSTSDALIKSTVDSLSACVYELIVNVSGYGLAISNQNTTVLFTVDAITPNSGSILGKQTVSITGTGIDVQNTNVLICDRPCIVIGGSSNEIKCLTPNITSVSDKTCDVNITTIDCNNRTLPSVVLTSAFTYLTTNLPTILSIDPLIGGTGGGTTITLSGNFLGSTKTPLVMVGDVQCTVKDHNETNIVCTTGPWTPSAKLPVTVTLIDKGQVRGDFMFYYVDRWSSQFTWGNGPIPKENDFVSIGKGQNVMLDTDTPILTMLLINGGTLFFDPTKNINLNAKYILVLNNGLFKIGSPEEPYEMRAVITLHGHVRDKELPLYGAKVLALRNGTLSLHGKPRPVTWTRLVRTAEVGATVIQLQHPVDWLPNEHIIITSTGDKFSHGESEEHIIKEVAADNVTITLQSPIAYRKLGVTITYPNGLIGNFAAEVGLLSRNILIQGSQNTKISSDTAKCSSDFSADQFVTQTCVQGKLSEQLGVDNYGGHVHIGGPYVDSGVVRAYLSYVELYFMGQAFRLGRYPIHFHLNGYMTGSYVRGCSIHKSFNRAVNIHNTHEILVENNVVYDVMGGALFLEDGIEHGNIIRQNLFIHVVRTSSLLNDDTIPSAYWITQPNNTVEHNVAASGTHFGFWYRMLTNPSGPSSTTTVCPRLMKMGKFYNNTVHSQGWFALWIHEIYYPTKTGKCGSRQWDKAVFSKLFAWNNNKGPECVDCGGVQFDDMLLVNNDEAGIEAKLLKNGNLYNPTTGPVYKNILIVGQEQAIKSGFGDCHTKAVILPWSKGLTVTNITMANFNGPNCTAIHGTVITCQCSKLCGGYEYLFSGIKWQNTTNRAEFRWHADFSLRDVDGSLVEGITGLTPIPGALIVAYARHLPKDKCGPTAPNAGDLGSNYGQGRVKGVRCLPEVTALRFSVDNPNPKSIVGSNMTITLLGGDTEHCPYKTESLTDGSGWMTTLVNNHSYVVGWSARNTFTNLSYVGYLENFRPGDYVIIRHEGMKFKPDRASVLHRQAGKPPLNVSLNPELNENGDVYYNETGNFTEYIVKNPFDGPMYRSYRLVVSFYKCYFPNCVTPPRAPVKAVNTDRPSDALFYSKDNTWTVLGTKPTNGSKLVIPKDKWLVLDQSININFTTLDIQGTLEIESGSSSDKRDYRLGFQQLVIKGGALLAGLEPDKPLTDANLLITLIGIQNDGDAFTDLGGPIIGPKSIAVYGALSLHAKPRNVTWCRLRQTANSGDLLLYLSEPVVNWQIGDRIVVTTTDMNYKHSELNTIADISSDKQMISLSNPLKYKHVVYNELYGSVRFETGAEIGHLTSNIKIQGDGRSVENSFGGRLLVSQALVGNKVVTGTAQLSGVHFYHMGQIQNTLPTDARLPVAFISAGDVGNTSYVRSCIFEESLSTALGAFATNDLPITNNVFYKSYGPAIQLKSKGYTILSNLIIEAIWSGKFLSANANLQAETNTEAALDLIDAAGYTLIGNAVSGAERICLKTQGLPCDGNLDSLIQNNVLHSCLVGIAHTKSSFNCILTTNYDIYSTSKLSVYWRTSSSIVARSLKLVDNAGSIYSYVGGPSGRLNIIHNKTFYFQDSLLVGFSTIQDCDNSADLTAVKTATKIGGTKSPDGGYLGMTSGQFMSSMGMPDKMGLTSWSSDNSNGGASYVQNVTIANYGKSCPGRSDYVWRADPLNQDGIAPTYMSDITGIQLNSDTLVYYNRPRMLRTCGRIQCEAQKKVLLVDKTGGLFGAPTIILPQSEYKFDSSLIPSRLLKTAGVTQATSTVAWPNRGVIRDNTCAYQTSMQAYKCGIKLNQRIMLFESLDVDALERTLAPVALATENLNSNFIDLINGPSDHGQCSSYDCLKRMSTFQLIVAEKQQFVLYTTSTVPQNLRLRLPQADPDYAVSIGIDYSPTGRHDVYVNGVYTKPKNAGENSQKQMVLLEPTTPTQYMPDVNKDSAGANYFDEQKSLLYVIVKGEAEITVKLAPLVKVSFNLPAMTEAEFFSGNVVSNLANFLGVPAANIRIVKIVSESGAKRKRRSAGTQVELEISEPPAANGTNTQANNNSTSSNTTTIQQVSSLIISAVQSGTFSSVLNTTVSGVAIVEPPPLPGSEQWSSLTSSNQTDIVSNNKVIQIPSSLSISLLTSNPTEHDNISIRIGVLDEANKYVNPLGSDGSLWLYEIFRDNVSIKDGNFQLGNQGYQDINDLSFTDVGEIMLTITVSSPDKSKQFQGTFVIQVGQKQFLLKAKLNDSLTNLGYLYPDKEVTLFVEIYERTTNELAQNLDWKDLIWKFEVSLCPNTFRPDNVTIANAIATFSSSDINNVCSINIRTPNKTGFYEYCIIGQASSRNNSEQIYDLGSAGLYLEVRPLSYTRPQRIITKSTSFKFAANYNAILPIMAKFKMAVLTKLSTLFPNVLFENITLSPGSILVKTNVVGGNLQSVQQSIVSLQNLIATNQLTLSIDGFSYIALQSIAAQITINYFWLIIIGLTSIISYVLL